MKYLLTLSFLSVLVLSNSLNAQSAKKWKIDKSHASVRFSINHFFSEVPGKFSKFDGVIHFDPNNLDGSKASFEIDVNSVSTDDETRDADLKGESFFNATAHPKIIFKSSSFVKKSDDLYEVHGELTMRGTNKTVVLPMKIKGRMDNPWKEGYEIMGIAIKTMLNRTDFGIGTGSWAATAIVSDEVEVRISMELDAPK